MKRFFIGIILFFVFLSGAKASYDLNDRCQQAWMLIMDFEFEKASQLLNQEISENPENYFAYYLDQTADAYRLFINGTKNDYEIFLEEYDRKRSIMDDHDEESPYYLACSSEMKIQLGLFNILEGEEFSGLKKMYSAYKDVYRNLERFPGFEPSVKLDGFFDVAIGNLPPFVKWAVSFFGVKADIEGGFEKLFDNYEKQKDKRGLNAEAALFMIFTAKINKTPERVYSFTHILDSSITNTFVHQYFRANIAYRTARNSEALEILSYMDKDKNQYTQLISDYLLGKVLMRKLDRQADFYLKRYLKNHKKLEYFREINYQLALYYLLNDEETKYEKHKILTIEKGMELQERDREALYDAKINEPPLKELIKAQLLFSGGYFEECQQYFNQIEFEHIKHPVQKLNYILLKAKIAENAEDKEEAIKAYQRVIELGENEEYSNASEAAMYLGYIHKNKGQISKADFYFKKSLKLYKSEYYEYIEDKARKGKSKQ